jgi:hypothetical protein
MKVTLTIELLNDAGSWDILDQIVFHFLERRHLWSVTDVVEIENSGWIQADKGGRASNRNLEILQKCYTDSIYPNVDRKMHVSTITITLKPASLTEFAPTDARSYLAQPVYVFVENSTSDGAFLSAMLQAFKRAELVKAKRDGWWVLEPLGGFGELERRIAQTRQQS